MVRSREQMVLSLVRAGTNTSIDNSGEYRRDPKSALVAEALVVPHAKVVGGKSGFQTVALGRSRCRFQCRRMIRVPHTIK
jgi:hypothetical protein